MGAPRVGAAIARADNKQVAEAFSKYTSPEEVRLMQCMFERLVRLRVADPRALNPRGAWIIGLVSGVAPFDLSGCVSARAWTRGRNLHFLTSYWCPQV